jgi:cellulose biosynthesis protein BcsQ
LAVSVVFPTPPLVDIIDITFIKIYSNDHSNQLQSWLASKGDGRFRLKIAINKLVEEYDYILIDTQGAKGNLQDAASRYS